MRFIVFRIELLTIYRKYRIQLVNHITATLKHTLNGNLIFETSYLAFLHFLIIVPISILAANGSLIKFDISFKFFLRNNTKIFSNTLIQKPSGFIGYGYFLGY